MTEQETGELVAPDFAARRLRKQLRRLRPLLIVGAVLVLVIGAFWALYFSPLLTVQAVQVTGTTTISVVQIKQVAEVPIGDQLVRVDLAAIQARVETIPAVRSVSVSRSWPHDITIAVSERVPIAVVSRGATLQSLDADGVLFGHYGRRPAGLLLVKTPLNVSATALVEAAAVVSALPSDIAIRVHLIEVVTPDDITLDVSGGVTVLWGSAADSDNKAKVLRVLLKKHVTQIDVSVPGRPTAR